MQIEFDPNTNEVSIGKWKTHTYNVGYSRDGFAKGTTPPWKKWVRAVADANGVHLSYDPKHFAKEAAVMFKRPPKAMYEHYKKLAYKAFVVPNQHILKKIGFAPGRINTVVLNKIVANKEILEQVYDDKLYNILPIVAEVGRPPQKLKKELGATWKKIANNSLNKNKHLAKYSEVWYNKICNAPTTVLKTFEKYSKSYVGDYGKAIEHGMLEHVALHYKGKWSNSRVMHDAAYMFMDTTRMAEKLSRKVDPKWTPRRLKEEHDKMAQEINALRYSPQPFEWMQKEHLPRELVVGDYKAVLLDNAKAIADEGNIMGHCVGSYAEYSRGGDYVVYSVLKDGAHSSTIGFAPHIRSYVIKGNSETKTYRFSQHYGRWNAHVTDEVEKRIPEKLLALLNKKELENV